MQNLKATARAALAETGHDITEHASYDSGVWFYFQIGGRYFAIIDREAFGEDKTEGEQFEIAETDEKFQEVVGDTQTRGDDLSALTRSFVEAQIG